jgi:hypothetical protein
MGANLGPTFKCPGIGLGEEILGFAGVAHRNYEGSKALVTAFPVEAFKS